MRRKSRGRRSRTSAKSRLEGPSAGGLTHHVVAQVSAGRRSSPRAGMTGRQIQDPASLRDSTTRNSLRPRTARCSANETNRSTRPTTKKCPANSPTARRGSRCAHRISLEQPAGRNAPSRCRTGIGAHARRTKLTGIQGGGLVDGQGHRPGSQAFCGGRVDDDRAAKHGGGNRLAMPVEKAAGQNSRSIWKRP